MRGGIRLGLALQAYGLERHYCCDNVRALRIVIGTVQPASGPIAARKGAGGLAYLPSGVEKRACDLFEETRGFAVVGGGFDDGLCA